MRSTRRMWEPRAGASAAAAAAATTLLLLLLAPPAGAKGIESVAIDGPGLAEPVELSTDPPAGDGAVGGGIAVYDDAGREVGLIDELNPWVAMGEPVSPQQPDAPTADLGPAYSVTWRVYGLTSPIEQDLYPFAAGGPLVHISAEQTRGYRTDDTWYRAPASVLTILAEVKVIAGDASGPLPPEPTSPAAGPRGPSGATSEWPRTVVAGAASAAAAVLVAGGLPIAIRRARRRRSARQMAPTSL